MHKISQLQNETALGFRGVGKRAWKLKSLLSPQIPVRGVPSNWQYPVLRE